MLFSLAYRMLSSVQDAEDVVQEACVRWLQSSQEEVRSPKDYLCATVTRLRVLAPDVTLLSDGGGKVRSAINPIYGADRVARFMLGIQRKPGPIWLAFALVNGQPGILRYVKERLHSAISFEVEDGQIRRIFMVANPDKLPAHLRPGVH